MDTFTCKKNHKVLLRKKGVGHLQFDIIGYIKFIFQSQGCTGLIIQSVSFAKFMLWIRSPWTNEQIPQYILCSGTLRFVLLDISDIFNESVKMHKICVKNSIKINYKCERL